MNVWLIQALSWIKIYGMHTYIQIVYLFIFSKLANKIIFISHSEELKYSFDVF